MSSKVQNKPSAKIPAWELLLWRWERTITSGALTETLLKSDIDPWKEIINLHFISTEIFILLEEACKTLKPLV